MRSSASIHCPSISICKGVSGRRCFILCSKNSAVSEDNMGRPLVEKGGKKIAVVRNMNFHQLTAAFVKGSRTGGANFPCQGLECAESFKHKILPKSAVGSKAAGVREDYSTVVGRMQEIPAKFRKKSVFSTGKQNSEKRLRAALRKAENPPKRREAFNDSGATPQKPGLWRRRRRTERRQSLCRSPGVRSGRNGLKALW